MLSGINPSVFSGINEISKKRHPKKGGCLMRILHEKPESKYQERNHG